MPLLLLEELLEGVEYVLLLLDELLSYVLPLLLVGEVLEPLLL